MDITNRKYEKLNDEFRNKLEKDLQMAVVEQFRKEEMEEHFYKYEVQLQNVRFITYMSDEELESSIKMTIDLLEEMKEINNKGLCEQELRKRVADIEENNEDKLMRDLHTWNILCSEKIVDIIRKLDVVRRVGGAYAMLISNPCLKSAIYVVYERLVDHFNDVELFCHSAFFLLRAIMRMHSDDIKDGVDL